MSTPRSKLLLIKQFLKNSTPKSLKTPLNSYFISKPFSNKPSSKNPLLSEVLKFVAKSPNSCSSIGSFLDSYYAQSTDLKHAAADIRNVIRKLRRQKRFDRALEVSEWMMNKTCSDPASGDLASQLSLIFQVHGLDAAEKFFNDVDLHSEKMYGALLNCYVEAKLANKCLSHFKKMKDMGLAMSPLPYNNVMTLYMNTGQDEKVPELISEMEENGVSPDNFTFRICLKSFAVKSDFSSIEKLLRKMESQHGFVIDWLTYVVVANYYIEGGYTEKAVYYLQQAELRVHGNPVGYNNLITTYAKIGELTQIMRLWKKRRGTSKAHINADYTALISSLVKLDQYQEAEGILQEWESCCSFYDFRVVNVLLLGYIQKGQVENAENLLEGIVSRRLTPIPNTWIIICHGHIKCGNMHKALVCFKKALEVGSGLHHEGWIPNYEVTSSVLKWLGETGEIKEVEEFLKLIPMTEEGHQTLLRAYVRHGKEIDNILKRMEDENIEVSDETRMIIASMTES